MTAATDVKEIITLRLPHRLAEQVRRVATKENEQQSVIYRRLLALTQMIATGCTDHDVMAVSGHSSTRMLERYTHPTEQRKLAALESFAPALGRKWAERETDRWKRVGGRQEARTPDLRVANAALSQLS